LADYVHSKGLLFGIYGDAGTHTCANRAGSLNFEYKDAQVFAEWGVDYLKYDNCNNTKLPAEKRYQANALNAAGRPTYFSLCEWGENKPYIWGPGIAGERLLTFRQN
ncbi:9163_t:CDS:2, partial [Scutellospora calospora]